MDKRNKLMNWFFEAVQKVMHLNALLHEEYSVRFRKEDQETLVVEVITEPGQKPVMIVLHFDEETIYIADPTNGSIGSVDVITNGITAQQFFSNIKQRIEIASSTSSERTSKQNRYKRRRKDDTEGLL